MEIKANELRIGNWVAVGENQSTVTTISYDLVHLMGNMITNRVDQVDPIPLTPEILEKSGFELWKDKKTLSIEFENGNTIIITDTEIFLGGYDSSTGGQGFTMEVKNVQCVHQLQNLYFALTSEELNIKL